MLVVCNFAINYSRPSHGKMTLLSVSKRFLALNTFVQLDQTRMKPFILRKVIQMTNMKVVVIFGIFDANCAMVLLISPKQINLEGCACAQIKTLKEGNWWLHPDNAWERDRNAANLIIYYSDSGGLFCPFFSIWCHGSDHISLTN